MLKKRRKLRGRIETFQLDSRVLRGNALGDPHRRAVTVYVPPAYDRQPTVRYPVFVDLVGFMGSGPAHVQPRAFDESVPERLERLARAGEMGPVIAVFPDCWTRLGGNQYINSSAVGRYADYILREILPAVDRRYRTFAEPRRRAVFGKSSGGYGAIVHGMRYARHWGAVACHSGDMYFDFCYRNDVPGVLETLGKHGRSPERFLRHFYQQPKASSGDGMTLMFLAMAAFYDPDPKSPLGFRLPMDLRTGEFDERRWSRWKRHDPVHRVNLASAQRQLRSLRGVFIDCGTRDQFHLLYGARILHDRLTRARIPHRYGEFDDDHSSIDYRMDSSLPWLYAKIMGRRAKRPLARAR
jgi:enterochelin esterase-like enzyme